MIAGLGAVLIWAAWIVATRYAVGHAIEPSAVAVLRFGVPALLFAPVWWRIGLVPKNVPWPVLLALLGFGAPFFLLVGYAMRYAPAADAPPLLSGTMPLIVAGVALAFGEKFGLVRKFGLALIGASALAIVAASVISGSAAWHGHLLLLGAAGLWALYTLAFKKSGLTAVEAAAVVAVWSAILLLPVGAPALISNVIHGRLTDVLVQAGVQGVLSGVFAIVLYGLAITRLGASRGAAMTALVPPFAAMLGIPLLGEWPGLPTLIAIILTTAGVALAAGAFDGWRLPRRRGNLTA
jgi:drug/metabolite transporter (DMT)-like permease